MVVGDRVTELAAITFQAGAGQIPRRPGKAQVPCERLALEARWRQYALSW